MRYTQTNRSFVSTKFPPQLLKSSTTSLPSIIVYPRLLLKTWPNTATHWTAAAPRAWGSRVPGSPGPAPRRSTDVGKPESVGAKIERKGQGTISSDQGVLGLPTQETWRGES